MTPTDTGANLLAGMVALTLVIASGLAFPTTLALLWFYRRAVLKSMRARTRPARPTATPPPPAPGEPRPPLPIVDLNAAELPPAATAAHDLLRAPWRAAAVYGAAGASFALVMAVASALAYTQQVRPISLLFMTATYLWPVVLTTDLIVVLSRGSRFLFYLAYAGVYLAVGGLGIALSPALTWANVITFWLATNLAPTLLLALFLVPQIRSVGPLVLTFMLFAAAGLPMASGLLFSSPAQLQFFFNLLQLVGLQNYVMETGVGIGIGALALAGWTVLWWIRRAYVRQQLSDQSLILDTVWLLYGVVTSLVLGSPAEYAGFVLAFVPAFLLYQCTAWVGFAWLRRRRPAPPDHKLLLLRVFALGRRSEQLFQALERRWRYVGSLQLIAGPDLATSTIEPHEFLDFLSGKLARRFIDGRTALERRLTEREVRPDQEGRYRVHDLFCHDDTWQMTLTRLAYESQVVLMDLRNFAPRHGGCVFEITELIQVIPLPRVVFMMDASTDEAFFHTTVQNAWQHLSPKSPNRPLAQPVLNVFRFTGRRRGEFNRLLQALQRIAQAGAPDPGQRTVPDGPPG